jgi:hypothetical protein
LSNLAAAINQISQGETRKLMAGDPWSWAYYNKMRLNAGPFKVFGHEFQRDILQSTYRRQCAKKSPQMMGLTECMVIRSLHGLRFHRYPQGVLYIFPTDDEVSDFSKSRFKPFLTNNVQSIGKFVKETDTAQVKRVGNAFLFFRGGRLKDIEGSQMSSSKLKALPVDALVGDEIDEMDPTALTLALGRMDHSKVQDEFYLANPTVPGWGIDEKYNASDGRVWMIECPVCGKESCLELEFPGCLQRQSKFSNVSAKRDPRKDRGVLRICKKCENEINPRKGYWIPQFPSKTEDMVGWWISHLNSMYTDPKTILDEYEDPKTDMVRFHNRRLGMAYVRAEDRLTVNAVLQCCGTDAMKMSDDGPCCAGADVQGDHINVLIAHKVHAHGLKLLKIGKVPGFNELWDICGQFHVASIVMDLKPEIHSVREFCTKAPFKAFGCDYSEESKGIAVWNDASNIVTVNRTEIFDASHKQITEPGRTELPRIDSEIKEFAKQMCATVKTLEDKKAHGNVIGKVYRYKGKIGGPDDYRNAMNYLMLAAQQAPVISRAGPASVTEIEFYYG